jgi:hypothetical protein
MTSPPGRPNAPGIFTDNQGKEAQQQAYSEKKGKYEKE